MMCIFLQTSLFIFRKPLKSYSGNFQGNSLDVTLDVTSQVTAFTNIAHLIKHPRLNKISGNLVWELLKTADLMIHGPNTPDTHANSSLPMFLADTASRSQHLSDRICIWLYHSGTAKCKRLARERQPNATLVLCTCPLLTIAMLSFTKICPSKPYHN